MKIFAVLVICFALVYGQNENGKKPDDPKCGKTMDKFMQLVRTCGMLTFALHKFDIEPKENWMIYAKRLVKEQKSEYLKGLSEGDIEEIYGRISKDSGSSKKIILYKFEAKISGPMQEGDLDGSWSFNRDSEEVGLVSGTKFQGKSLKPVLETKDGFKIEFELGPEIWEEKGSSLSESGEKLIVSDATLDTKVEDDRKKIEYSVFVCDFNGFPHSTQPDEKVTKVKYGIINTLIEDIQGIKPERHSEVEYSYTSRTRYISLKDDSLQNFLQRFVSVVDCSTVNVDLYGLVGKVLKNPDAVGQYGKDEAIPHGPEEFFAHNREQYPLIAEKLPSGGLYGYPKDFGYYKQTNDEELNKQLDEDMKPVIEQLKKEPFMGEKGGEQVQKMMFDIFKKSYERHRKANNLTQKSAPPFKYFSGTMDIKVSDKEDTAPEDSEPGQPGPEEDDTEPGRPGPEEDDTEPGQPGPEEDDTEPGQPGPEEDDTEPGPPGPEEDDTEPGQPGPEEDDTEPGQPGPEEEDTEPGQPCPEDGTELGQPGPEEDDIEPGQPGPEEDDTEPGQPGPEEEDTEPGQPCPEDDTEPGQPGPEEDDTEPGHPGPEEDDTEPGQPGPEEDDTEHGQPGPEEEDTEPEQSCPEDDTEPGQPGPDDDTELGQPGPGVKPQPTDEPVYPEEDDKGDIPCGKQDRPSPTI